MSSPRSFVLVDDALHGKTVDDFIMARLRDVDGSKGSQWSGVFTDGTRFGVLWAAPASQLFGVPITEDPENGDPSVVIATDVINEDGTTEWELVAETPAETPDEFTP